VVATPKDESGLLLGPGHAAQMQADLAVWTLRGRTREALQVHDRGDGSYLIEVVTSPAARAARLELRLDGQRFAKVPVVDPPWWLFWMRWL
jgi:hypothetical protein